MSIRKTTIFSTIFIFLFNAIIVLTYYRFYLDNQYNKELELLTNSYSTKLESVIEQIKKTDDLNSLLDEITKGTDVNIVLEDSTGNVIYGVKNNKSYAAHSIVEYNKNTYIISYSDSENVKISNYLIIQNFVIFQVALGIVFIILGMIFANSKILSPIIKLQEDVKQYKDGIKPLKRKVKTSIDEVQNTFVDLVLSLDKEKDKQNRIIASISHDIKTPLTSIMGYADRLENAKLSEETKLKYIKKIHNNSLVMKELIEEFDDYLSCNINDSLKMKSIKISELVDILKEDYELELKDKNIKFKIKTTCPNSYVNIDLFKIKRVFSNIITNSINHNIDKENKKIEIEIYKRKKDICFNISDNGKGVKEEYLEKIFEPLFTTDPSRKISGLGLSICKQIIDIHNGKIYAYNNNYGFSIEFILKEKK